MFQLTKNEKAEEGTNDDHLSRLKFSPALLHTFEACLCLKRRSSRLSELSAALT